MHGTQWKPVACQIDEFFSILILGPNEQMLPRKNGSTFLNNFDYFHCLVFREFFGFSVKKPATREKKVDEQITCCLLVKHERTSDQKLHQSKAMFHMQENLVVPEKAQIILLGVLDHLKD